MSKRLSIGRREFLAQASVAGAGGVIGVAGMGAEAFGARQIAPAGVELSHFANSVGSTFVVASGKTGTTTAPGKPVALVLKSATAETLQKGDLRLKGKTVGVNGGNRLRTEPFALLFSAPGGEQLEQETYVAVRRDFGKLHLFLVPMPFKEDGTRHEKPHYVACFN